MPDLGAREIRDGVVRWRPVVDLNRVLLVLAFLGLWALRR
jgi:hypothetical protein